MDEDSLKGLLEEAFRRGCEWGRRQKASEAMRTAIRESLAGRPTYPYRVVYLPDLDPRYTKRIEIIVQCGSAAEAKEVVKRVEDLPEGVSMKVIPEARALFE